MAADIEEVEIDGETYRIRLGDMDSFTQGDVAWKLFQFVPELVSVLRVMEDADLKASIAKPTSDPIERGAEAVKAMDWLSFIEATGPVARALAKMPIEDRRFVETRCLAIVERKSGNTWAKIMAPNGTLMFKDLTYRRLLPILGTVIRKRFGDFFPEGGLSLSPPSTGSS